MKKLLIVVLLVASTAQAQGAGQKALAQKLATAVKGLKVVPCPKLPGGRQWYELTACVLASGKTTAQAAQEIKVKWGAQFVEPQWGRYNTVYFNQLRSGDLQYVISVDTINKLTYVSIGEATRSPAPRTLSPQSRRAFDTLVIRLTGEVVPCADKPDPAKVCALTILSPELVKQWVSLSSDMKQVTPWTRTVGEMLEADFTVGGVPHTMFVSDLGSKGTLIQWVR